MSFTEMDGMLWTTTISKMNSVTILNYEAFKVKSFKNALALGTSLDFKSIKWKSNDDGLSSRGTRTTRIWTRIGYVWVTHAKNIVKNHMHWHHWRVTLSHELIATWIQALGNIYGPGETFRRVRNVIIWMLVIFPKTLTQDVLMIVLLAGAKDVQFHVPMADICSLMGLNENWRLDHQINFIWDANALMKLVPR